MQLEFVVEWRRERHPEFCLYPYERSSDQFNHLEEGKYYSNPVALVLVCQSLIILPRYG
jgi:hypothetical protein